MIIMTTTAAGYGEHQAGGGRGEEVRIQQSTTTTGGPPSIAATTAAAAKDDAAALDSTKIRKPYTITKQRERWTDEEHQKFLEALKLYGRAWRRIEEHIGTKTAVQIRSHAQKFFSKVERDHQIAAAATAGGGGIGKGGVVVVPEGLIDIPPPRPKRKPSHPYPRKAREELLEERSSPHDALPPKDSISEEDKQLPAAVAPPPPPVQQVLSEPSWVPFPAFHAFPPQWGNSSFWNQLPNAPNHQHPACQNFENWAQFVGGSMPREHKPPWYHPSQMAYNSAAAMATAALWPAVVSGASSTITPVPNFSEFNGSQSLFKGNTGSENEDGASKAAVAGAAASAATIAAASAWWAFTQSLASPLSFAAMGALYNPFIATMPSPLLFPQGKWLEQTKLQNLEPAAGEEEEEEEEEEDTPQVQTLEEPTSKELLCSSSSGHHGLVRSSAAHRVAERAIWVQEVKARRGMMTAMGSSSAGSSDICASSSQGGSCSKPESGDGGSKGSRQELELVKNHNHSGERKCTSPSSAGSSPPTQLHKLKSQLSGLVQKELSSAHARRSGDEQQREDEVGFENWKQLQDETFSGFSMNCHPVTSQCLLPALQFVKSGDLSGSNSFPTKGSNENPTEKSSSEEEHHHPPEVQTPSGSEECGSDGGILTAENNTSAEEDSGGGGGGGGGPSSNSSACGNLPEGNDHSGSSDGSSDVEATPNVPSSCKEENEAKIVETVTEEEAAQVSSRCFSDDGFTPFRKDNEKHVHEGCAVRHLLPRSLSLEAEQQKEEAMGRHQTAFRVLFARETLPRTFSPPPRGDSLEALQAPAKSLSPHLRSRISSHSKASSFVSLPAADEDHHPCTTACVADQHDNSAFNAWQPSKASKSTTAEIERCESCSIITTSSGAPQVTTKGTETQWCPKRTRDTKRRERYGEGGATFDWLTLRTESSRIPEQVKDDFMDLHFNLHQEESLHQQQSLTHNIDLFPRLKKEKFAVACSSKLDDTRSSLAFSEIISSEPFLSGSSSNTHSSVSFLMARPPPPSSSSSGTAAALSTVSSNLSVKYSSVGFVPYQRVPSSEP
ncbi:hypothetical protein BDL97_15G012600 [Sphagnum fallax]|nr:hypothetical protein BDL97_15G012600 [Sphagnum fallax]